MAGKPWRHEQGTSEESGVRLHSSCKGATMINRDQLNTGASPANLRRAAFRVISQTQDDPSVQVMAMAVALYATCDALKIDIRQLMVSMERMKDDLDGPFTSTFAAIEAYALNEIGRE